MTKPNTDTIPGFWIKHMLMSNETPVRELDPRTPKDHHLIYTYKDAVRPLSGGGRFPRRAVTRAEAREAAAKSADVRIPNNEVM